MYWSILDNKRIELLRKIVKTVSLNNYYMAGGTALSLQLNLRESFDFDFCVPDMFNSDVLISELKSIGNIEVKQNQKGTVDVLLDGLSSFDGYLVGLFVELWVMVDKATKKAKT